MIVAHNTNQLRLCILLVPFHLTFSPYARNYFSFIIKLVIIIGVNVSMFHVSSELTSLICVELNCTYCSIMFLHSAGVQLVTYVLFIHSSVS